MARKLAGQMPNPGTAFFCGRTVKVLRIPAFLAILQYTPVTPVFGLQRLHAKLALVASDADCRGAGGVSFYDGVSWCPAQVWRVAECLFDVDFTAEGSKVLAGEVVCSIEAALAA